ncbi:MAG: DUF4064 domain-containing protein [Bacteroidetes bacterium]|nr:DUF4064 domain-containing protein [Bacteroidota bacterium]
MSQETTNDLLNQNDESSKKLSSGLNVLTILTFIGCAFWGILTLLTPVINKFLLGLIEKAQNSGQELPAKQAADLEKGKAALELASQNMIPLIVIGMVGIILSFVGALWMRKLKKEGYLIYIIGEITPIVGGIIIMGAVQFTGVFNIIIGIVIPVLFMVLYTLQRKYLVK